MSESNGTGMGSAGLRATMNDASIRGVMPILRPWLFGVALIGCGPMDPGISETDDTGATASASVGGVETTGETGETGMTGETGETGACDFEGAIQPIFTAYCANAGCHGANPQLGLELSEGAAFGALVGVQSVSQPDKLLVSAGDPAASVLVDKLGVAPSAGQRMPVGGSLSDSEIALIEAWISAGAQPSATFACAGGGSGSDVGGVVIDPGLDALEVGDLASPSTDSRRVEGELVHEVALSRRHWGDARQLRSLKGALIDELLPHLVRRCSPLPPPDLVGCLLYADSRMTTGANSSPSVGPPRIELVAQSASRR